MSENTAFLVNGTAGQYAGEFQASTNAVRLYGSVSAAYNVQVWVGNEQIGSWTDLYLNGQQIQLTPTNPVIVLIVPGLYRVIASGATASSDIIYYEESIDTGHDDKIIYVMQTPGSAGGSGPTPPVTAKSGVDGVLWNVVASNATGDPGVGNATYDGVANTISFSHTDAAGNDVSSLFTTITGNTVIYGNTDEASVPESGIIYTTESWVDNGTWSQATFNYVSGAFYDSIGTNCRFLFVPLSPVGGLQLPFTDEGSDDFTLDPESHAYYGGQGV